MYPDLQKELSTFERRTPKSAEAHKKNLKRIPLGVASNYRAYDPWPIFVKEASGSKFRDLDGNEYIDHNLTFGALMAGHCHPAVMKAVEKRLSTGTMFGMPHDMEWELAEEICNRFPVEMCRFGNSGTEATMHAIRLARAATARDKIVKFEGAYHGLHDSALVSVKPHAPDFGDINNPTRSGFMTARTSPAAPGTPCSRSRTSSPASGCASWSRSKRPQPRCRPCSSTRSSARDCWSSSRPARTPRPPTPSPQSGAVVDELPPVLLAVSDNGPQMTSCSTREFMAMCAIAQHFGRPGTPTDQAWIESLLSHIKADWPHLDRIRDPDVLRAELAVVRHDYNTIRLHAGISYVTPADEHDGRGPRIRAARKRGLRQARWARIAYHRIQQSKANRRSPTDVD